ncbi:MAG: hypothetical protein V3U23_10660 [Kiloniellales bacterium]
MTARAQVQRDTDRGTGPILEAAAAAIEIKAFDLFALAHRWWFGRRLDRERLERVFAAYMFGGVVPPWARHYAREVLRELGSGAPDLTRFGFERPRESPRPPRRGRRIVAATAVVFALLFALILGTVADPDRGPAAPRSELALSCQGGGPGLAFFESLAYALSGRARALRLSAYAASAAPGGGAWPQTRTMARPPSASLRRRTSRVRACPRVSSRSQTASVIRNSAVRPTSSI